MQQPPPATSSRGPASAPAPSTSPGEPRDAWAYRLAIGGVSLALVAFLIGGAIIGSSGHANEMVKEYWTIGAALSGALVGILAPSPRQKRDSAQTGSSAAQTDSSVAQTGPSTYRAAILSTLDVLFLFIIVIACIFLATEVNSTDAALLRAIAAGAAGAMLGLLSPSPIKTGSSSGGKPGESPK